MMRSNRSFRVHAIALAAAFLMTCVLAVERRATAQSAKTAQSEETAQSSETAQSAKATRSADAGGAFDERFDHVGTRFILTGSHEGVACESCHSMGVFRGTPMRCGYCHDGSGMRAESGKPLDHVPTSNQCDDCHTTFTWLEVRFEHSGVTGACSSCHNDLQAEGKPPGHVVTNLECDFCHSTFVWESIRFDHSNITQPCSSCHNGIDATGKDMDHLTTNAECDVCHSTRAWSPAIFDHSNITQPCSSCHNGIDATGKDMDHLTTNAECDVCHSTRAWSPAIFDHSNITQPCSTCHDGVTATGTPTGHFVTSRECDECHTTSVWDPDIFRHMSANYPGDHARNLDCTECHPANTEAVVYTDDPGLAPDCAGCHRNDFKSGPHKQYENPDHSYTAAELRDCSGACHIYTDSSLTVIKKRRSGEHRVSDRSFD